MDPRKVNGAVFLGLNGVVIKSHGGTDAEGYAAAIEMGHDMVANDIMKKISNDLARMAPCAKRLNAAVADQNKEDDV